MKVFLNPDREIGRRSPCFTDSLLNISIARFTAVSMIPSLRSRMKMASGQMCWRQCGGLKCHSALAGRLFCILLPLEGRGGKRKAAFF